MVAFFFFIVYNKIEKNRRPEGRQHRKKVFIMEKTTVVLLDTKKRKTKRPSIEILSDLYANHTTKQIAEIYQVPEGTVKSWIYRYRQEQAREVRAWC